MPPLRQEMRRYLGGRLVGSEFRPGMSALALSRRTRRTCLVALGFVASALLAGCGSISLGSFGFGGSEPAPQTTASIGSGQVRVGLILPLSAGGNAGLAAQSMRNAAEMALAEFNSPNLQLLVKDDAGTAQGAQQATQQAIDEGAEIILGPLFAQAVGPAGQAARARGIPVIAFSTDANVAGRGIYLLSFLPESDVDRIVDYAVERGKRSIAALLPENAYGSVVEAALRQVAARKGARIIAIERYPADRQRMQDPVRRIAQIANQADAIFIPDDPDSVVAVGQTLVTAGVNMKRVQLLGTGLWESSRIFAEATLHGGWYPAPDPAGYRSFATRYRSRYGQDPIRTATLSYDAVSLVAALVKTQGPQRFSEPVLTSSAGFAGVDGIFRFRPDGTNDRGLAVLRVTPGGGQVISPAPKNFAASGT
jgi:ABC-type branched-subunit amino acid transport system substrate-binding protein